MLDFLMISTKSTKRDNIEIYPKFIIKKSHDLMIRGGDFYAIWNEEKHLWSLDEQDAIHMIDEELDNFAKENASKYDAHVTVSHMWDSTTGVIDAWHKYCQKQMRDSFHELDDKLIFSNQSVKKTDYASKTLTYPLEEGDIPAYNELMSVLYSTEERRKIEWAIGAIVSGDSKDIQKFVVFYGPGGTGKSTVLNIISQLFDGYCTGFDSRALGSATNAFALEAFKSNPLVAIQHDGDLSRIEDNTKLNSLVSHESMTVNEKFKATYIQKFKTFLLMGTNKPVKITDGKSGLIRRLIDVSPTGKTIEHKKYRELIKKIPFEYGGIAHHCLNVYLEDPDYYDNYRPMSMLGATNDFYNFVLDSYDILKSQGSVTRESAWKLYKEYCSDANVAFPLVKRSFTEELKNYFKSYEHRTEDGSKEVFVGFLYEKLDYNFEDAKPKNNEPELEKWLSFTKQHSRLDDFLCEFPAQYGSENEKPTTVWAKVKTKLKDLDTSKLHYVNVPEGENLVVIDFDYRGKDGKKSKELNLKAAAAWPKTYGEYSKSGAGVHLCYIYAGDTGKLSYRIDENVEVKVFTADASLRRKLSECNDLPIATISSGLPFREEKTVVNFEAAKSEKNLRERIMKTVNHEYENIPSTKSSVDFIYKITEDAYKSGLKYDISNMYNMLSAFAASSTNQSDYCLKLVGKMHLKSDEPSEDIQSSAPIIFMDTEIFPGDEENEALFIVCWKLAGKNSPKTTLYNPTPTEVEALFKYRIVGFNCKHYDNHLLYAASMGFTSQQLYELSQRIIVKKDKTAFFGEAYNLSYTDIYDFSAKKQTLKKFEIEFGIHHEEFEWPWDKPLPKELWVKAGKYCGNDVDATEVTWDHLQGDFIAREILADLTGLTVNASTNTLTTKFIFGNEKNPQLVYTDLATGKQDPGPQNTKVINAFPGYEYVYSNEDKQWHNMFMGTDLGRGGYVAATPGMYFDVALLDIQSLHPNSAVAMNSFGEFTKNFKDLLTARVLIKHKNYDDAKKLFNGKLTKYLNDPAQAKALAQALKIAINSVYGLTSAAFANPFRDKRNVNNIIALRGALFMRTLQDEVEKRGFIVAHIKTDSIKIPNATSDIIQFCMDFAAKYGYIFEHEATYDRMCLVNNAVYIAKYKDKDACEQMYEYCPEKNEDHSGEWTATGTQFQVPYVFKTLFSKEPIEFDDVCETKEVKTRMFIDFNENLGEDEHNYQFVGRVGQFCPIKEGRGGGLLLREKDGKYSAVTGTKGYRWVESETLRETDFKDLIDIRYYDSLVHDAVSSIIAYGDIEMFLSDDEQAPPEYIDDLGYGMPHPVYYDEVRYAA